MVKNGNLYTATDNLVVKNGNFTLLLTSSGNPESLNYETLPKTPHMVNYMAISTLRADICQVVIEWQFYTATDRSSGQE